MVFKEYQIFIIVAAFMSSGEYHAVQMTGIWDVGWQSFSYEKMLLLHLCRGFHVPVSSGCSVWGFEVM